MSGGKGGGSIDTSGLEEATNRAIDLQEEIYNMTREDVQPWYQMGVGATNRLSDLLGISGGSVMDREGIYNELLPQYTTQAQPVNYGSNLWTTPDGMVMSADGIINKLKTGSGQDDVYRGYNLSSTLDSPDSFASLMQDYGYSPTQMQNNESIVDYAGLNAAVDERLGNQTTPDDYGSLLEKFDLSKFEEDPGYAYRQQEANNALERQMAAQGITLGGAGFGDVNPQAYKAMQELNQGLASQEYGNAYNRYVQDQLNTFNMLMGAAGMGQGSTGILATGGQNYANNVGNLTTGLASAQLNADLAGQAQQGSMFSNMLGAGIGIAGLL